MLSMQPQVRPPHALARLRAHAFATGRPVADIAHNIVAGHLHLPRDPT
ncbi:hypothetical protein [Streptomyces sp. NPDC007100]